MRLDPDRLGRPRTIAPRAAAAAAAAEPQQRPAPPAEPQQRPAKRPRAASPLAAALARRGLERRAEEGDGNCLFRAVARQIYGDAGWHATVRQQCVAHLASDAAHFGPFVQGDFAAYVARKRRLGEHGDNAEIQAMAELYNRRIEVTGAAGEQLNVFHGGYKGGDAPLRLLYTGACHYDSLVDPYEASVGVGLGLPGLEPGKAERDLVREAQAASDAAATEAEVARAVMSSSLSSGGPTGGGGSSSGAGAGSSSAAAAEPDAVRELIANGFEPEAVRAAHLFTGGGTLEEILLQLLPESGGGGGVVVEGGESKSAD